jgi:formylglycine-generating enzyme required for sulfatase activity
MAGNVWEWMTNSYDGYPEHSNQEMKDFTPGDYDAPRRGGSYYEGFASVCCVARLGNRHDADRSNIGLRVVVAPSRRIADTIHCEQF